MKGYKQTELGIIPEDWKIESVGKTNLVTSGGTPNTNISKYWNGNIRWMNSGELNLKIVSEVQNRITSEGLKNSATKLIPKHCVLIGLAGQGKTRGTAAFNTIELCTNQSIAAIHPSTYYDQKFLYYNIDKRYDELRALSTGDGGRGGLNLSIIRNFKIPAPTNTIEQIKIAKALSETDDYITSLEKLIEKKKAIKQGVMQELLKPTDGWETKKLGEIGKTFGGLSGKSKNDFNRGRFPFIPFMNVMSNPIIDIHFFNYVNVANGESQNLVLKGDLIFNGSSETPEELGMCSILLNEIPFLYLNSFCFGFRLNKETQINGLYLSYYFRSKEGRKLFFSMAQGATRYNLSKANFNNLFIKIPSVKEQDKIAKILYDIDQELKTLEQKLFKAINLKLGMMQNLLTGKIRLA